MFKLSTKLSWTHEKDMLKSSEVYNIAIIDYKMKCLWKKIFFLFKLKYALSVGNSKQWVLILMFLPFVLLSENVTYTSREKVVH